MGVYFDPFSQAPLALRHGGSSGDTRFTLHNSFFYSMILRMPPNLVDPTEISFQI